MVDQQPGSGDPFGPWQQIRIAGGDTSIWTPKLGLGPHHSARRRNASHHWLLIRRRLTDGLST
jgi:hypothetical protein